MNRRFAFLRTSLALTVATAATLLTVVGSAAPARAAEAASVAVATDGIDLASRSGAARIEAAIDRAARQVCSNGDDRTVAMAMARRACIKAARADAMPKLDELAASARDARPALADADPTPAPVRR